MNIKDNNYKSVGIIGGGFSTLALLNKFSKDSKLKNFNYTVFDSNKIIGHGLPYGSSAHECFLMNSPVCRLDINNDNKDIEFWLSDNGFYDSKKVRSEYIPRKLYGKYLNWRFDYRNLKIKKIDSKVIKVIPKNDKYILKTKTDEYDFDYVILAIGSQENPNFSISTSNKNYFSSIYSNLTLLEEKLSNPNSSIAVIGTSSAFLDVMRMLQYVKLKKYPKIYAVSKSGNIPWPGIVNENVDYSLTLLNKETELSNVVKLLSEEMTLAFEKDVSILDIRSAVNTWLKSYFLTLSQNEKNWFMKNAASNFESLMKRGAPAVVDFTKKLIANNNISILAKKIIDVKENKYGKLSILFNNDELKVDCILNCLGSTKIRYSTSKLVQSLIKDCNCNITESESGFLVDDHFQIRKNFFAFGPAISGSFNKYGTFHHLENVKKIYKLSFSFVDEFKDSLTN